MKKKSRNMSNQKVLERIVKRFGLSRAKDFAEIAAFMYDGLYEDFIKDNPGEFTEYGYDKDWWKLKFEELKSRFNVKFIGKMSTGNKGGAELVYRSNAKLNERKYSKRSEGVYEGGRDSSRFYGRIDRTKPKSSI